MDTSRMKTEQVNDSERPGSMFLGLLLDLSMLGLALVSIGLLVIDQFWPALFFDQEYQQWLFARIDWTICGVFFVEFMARWAKSSDKAKFPLKNWYDILGMIPFTHPLLRGFRVLRLFRVVGAIARLRQSMDRLWGDGFAKDLVSGYRDTLIEVISDAVILEVLDVVEEVLQKGQYQEGLHKVMENHRESIHQLVYRNMSNSKSLSKLNRIPGISMVTESVADEVSDVVLGLSSDPEIDSIIKDAISVVVESIREEVQKIESERPKFRLKSSTAT